MFSLRRAFKRQPKVQLAAPVAVVETAELMSMATLKCSVVFGKHPQKVYGRMTPLASNENCDVYTVKDKKTKEQLVVKAVPCDEYDIEGDQSGTLIPDDSRPESNHARTAVICQRVRSPIHVSAPRCSS